MYYSNYSGQYKPNNKEGSWGILKKLPIQLAVVLVLMLSMIALRNIGGTEDNSISNKIKGFFYKDITKETEHAISSLSTKVQEILNEEGNTPDVVDAPDNNESPQLKATVALSCNPVAGVINITSPYGSRTNPVTSAQENHTGIDIQADIDTPVAAVMDGKVEQWYNDENYGLIIVIDHGNGIKTKYAHLSKVESSEPGQAVEKGQIIAYSGESGRVTGPHLHFEILIDGKNIDPQQYLIDTSSI